MWSRWSGISKRKNKSTKHPFKINYKIIKISKLLLNRTTPLTRLLKYSLSSNNPIWRHWMQLINNSTPPSTLTQSNKPISHTHTKSPPKSNHRRVHLPYTITCSPSSNRLSSGNNNPPPNCPLGIRPKRTSIASNSKKNSKSHPMIIILI